MPRLIFNTGKSKHVPYETAANIYQVLVGNKEPKDEAQAEYVLTIKHIMWDTIQDGTKPATVSTKDKTERQAAVNKIMNNPELTGRQKAREVSKLLGGKAK